MSREWTPALVKVFLSAPLLLGAGILAQANPSIRSWPLQSGNCESVPASENPQTAPKPTKKVHRHSFKVYTATH